MNTVEFRVPDEMPDAARGDMRSFLLPQEQRMVAELYPIAVQAFRNKETSDRFWTEGIKRVLAQIAKEQDLLCCHSGTTGEWLYDICWAETGPGAAEPTRWRAALRLVLACESEWSENENAILWDFMKLSWAQAGLRLFIYTNHLKRGTTLHPAVLCRDNCPASQGSRFLLIGFPKSVENGDRFRVDAWTT